MPFVIATVAFFLSPCFFFQLCLSEAWQILARLHYMNRNCRARASATRNCCSLNAWTAIPLNSDGKMGGKSFSAAAATEREERKSSINNINSNIIEATFFLFQRFNKNFPREEQKEKFFGLLCVLVCVCVWRSLDRLLWSERLRIETKKKAWETNLIKHQANSSAHSTNKQTCWAMGFE